MKLDYLEHPQTLGEHLRKARMQRELSQPQVARLLGTDAETILNWEKNRNTPTPKWAKKIIEFLDYFPFDWKDEDLQIKVNFARMVAGHSQREMGREIQVDESTIYKILLGKSTPQPATIEKIQNYIHRNLGHSKRSYQSI